MLVRFYRTASGASPVEKYLAGLEAKERAAVLGDLNNVQKSGLSAPGVVTRQIRGKLREIAVAEQRMREVLGESG